jgi:hypothetical protein
MSIMSCHISVADVHPDDVGAFLRQSDGVRAALPAGGPGNESDLAFDSAHNVLP